MMMPRQVEMPPLAHALNLADYKPQFGDFVLWSGWFSCWIGVVSDCSKNLEQISVVFAGLPILLFQMDESDQPRNTRILQLSQIRKARNGTFSILQQINNVNVWYV